MASILSDAQCCTWKENLTRSIAKSRKVRGGNYVQIATVDADNKPRNRTVVFRGFVSDSKNGSEALKMITDARSEKAQYIVDHKSFCEMVWWFSKTSEQYRIFGKLKLVKENDEDEHLLQARKQQWGNLSDAAREQFFWSQPGKEYSSEETASVPKGGRDGETNKVLPAPPNFLLLLLYPREVKYLNLRSNYSQFDKLVNAAKADNMDSTNSRKEIDTIGIERPSGTTCEEQNSVNAEKNLMWVSRRVNP